MAIVTGATGGTGNLINPLGAYTQPLVNLTSSLPRLGQFANQITQQSNVGRSTQASGQLGGQFGGVPAQLTGANNVSYARRAGIYPPIYQSLTGTYRNPYPGIANAGQTRSPYPQVFGTVNMTRETPYPGIANAGQVRSPYPQVFGSAINDQAYPGYNTRPKGPFRAIYPAYSQSLSYYQENKNKPKTPYPGYGQRAQPYSGTYDVPTPPGYGYRSINPGETQADVVRRQQINQLTPRYNGSLAAITGANMVEPVQIGFPGTDRRQNYPVSTQYATGIQAPQDLFASATSSPYYSSGGGYYGNGGYGGGGDGYTPYTQTGNILTWRVTTG